MDNNNQQPDQTPVKNEKANVWIIATVILVSLMVLAGGYWFMTNKSAQDLSKSQTTAQTEQDLNNIDAELQSLELGDIEKDLSDIDKDLKNL